MIRKLFQLGEWADAAEKFLDCLALLGKKKSCSQCFGSGSALILVSWIRIRIPKNERFLVLVAPQ
jgi:hypothetical protein